LRQIHEFSTILRDNRTDWHSDSKVFTTPSMLACLAAVTPTFCREFAVITKVHERVLVSAGYKNNIAALAAVATVGSTSVNEFFFTKTGSAIAAVARYNSYFSCVYKLHVGIITEVG
jgi:hypothetical protein